MDPEQREKDIKLREKEKNQFSVLRSGNVKAIVETLKDLRTGGRVAILPEVFNLLLDSDDEVLEACQSLLNDLKTQEGADALIDALKDERYKTIRGRLLSACWQNALDYHKEILLIAELFIEEDYASAIEAFTVIENSLDQLEDPDIVNLISKLNAAMPVVSEDKKPLLESLLRVIKDY